MATTTMSMSLADARFIDLTTFRRTGEPVRTPVLLIPDGDRLLVRTAAASGKLKRISHTPRVEVTPSDQRGRHLGPTATGIATILGPAAVAPTLARLHARYRIAGPLFSALRRVRGQRDVIIEIALDEPIRTSEAPRAVVDVDDVRRARMISGVTAAVAAMFLMGACASAPAAVDPSATPLVDPALTVSAGATPAPAVPAGEGMIGAGMDTADGASLCAVVTRDAVERALGTEVDDAIATDQGLVSGASCRYASADGHTRVRVWVHRPTTRATWDATMEKLGMTAGASVDGLGEAALILTGSPTRPRARLTSFAVDHDVWVDIVGARDQDVAIAAARHLAEGVLGVLAR